VTRDLHKKGPVPFRYWALWWTALGLAVVVFYVLLTPIWMGIRVAGWLTSKRGTAGSSGGAAT
jgi:hypothetical protein